MPYVTETHYQELVDKSYWLEVENEKLAYDKRKVGAGEFLRVSVRNYVNSLTENSFDTMVAALVAYERLLG